MIYVEDYFENNMDRISSGDERIINLIASNIKTIRDWPVKMILYKADVSPSSFYNFIKKNKVKNWKEVIDKIGAYSNRSGDGYDTESSMFKSIKWYLNINYEKIINSNIYDLINQIYKHKKILVFCDEATIHIAKIFESSMLSSEIECKIISNRIEISKILLKLSENEGLPKIALLHSNNVSEFNNLRHNIKFNWSIFSYGNEKLHFINDKTILYHFNIASEKRIPLETRPSWEYGALLVIDLIKHGINIITKMN